jgi:hypothetical protein
VVEESENIREVYAQYGLAMYQAQCVERQLAILAPMLHGMDPRRVTRPELEHFFEDLFRKSLGAMIAQLQNTVGLPGGFEDRLRKALRLRNWLAHNYFWERAGHFPTLRGRATMIRELKEAAAFLDSLDRELTSIASSYYESVGVSDELVQECFHQLVESADAI